MAGHMTYQTLYSLTFIDVCLTMTASKSQHAMAGVAVNHVLTAATILTKWTLADVWTDTSAVTICIVTKNMIDL